MNHIFVCSNKVCTFDIRSVSKQMILQSPVTDLWWNTLKKTSFSLRAAYLGQKGQANSPFIKIKHHSRKNSRGQKHKPTQMCVFACISKFVCVFVSVVSQLSLEGKQGQAFLLSFPTNTHTYTQKVAENIIKEQNIKHLFSSYRIKPEASGWIKAKDLPDSCSMETRNLSVLMGH